MLAVAKIPYTKAAVFPSENFVTDLSSLGCQDCTQAEEAIGGSRSTQHLTSAYLTLHLQDFSCHSFEIQAELELCLFEQMQAKKFGMEYFTRLKLVNRFFCEKRPLIITVCGVPSIGKSTFAQQLAARFNLSTVLQTDLIYEASHISVQLKQMCFRCRRRTAALLSPDRRSLSVQTSTNALFSWSTNVNVCC